MKKRVRFILIACFVMVVFLTGCVKVVPIGQEAKLTGDIAFNAAENVAAIWNQTAIPELERKAVDLPSFFKEANGDFKSLADKYGKYSMGKSGELNYVVKGVGIVTAVHREKKAGYIIVKLKEQKEIPLIKLQIGSVYKGAAVRDSLDFIKYEDYKNQVEWAKVSQSIHDVIYADVIKKIDLDAIQGKEIYFMGCFSVDKANEVLITPVELTVQ